MEDVGNCVSLNLLSNEVAIAASRFEAHVTPRPNRLTSFVGPVVTRVGAGVPPPSALYGLTVLTLAGPGFVSSRVLVWAGRR